MNTPPKIIFNACQKSLTNQDLDDVEKKLGFLLPLELKHHYLQFNGGTPEKAHWFIDEELYFEIANFKSIKYGEDEFSTIEDTYLRQTKDGVINDNFLPFAIDWGGNYFCIDLTTHEIVIYFMDTDKNRIRILEKGFKKFVNGLIQYDEDD